MVLIYIPPEFICEPFAEIHSRMGIDKLLELFVKLAALFDILADFGIFTFRGNRQYIIYRRLLFGLVVSHESAEELRHIDGRSIDGKRLTVVVIGIDVIDVVFRHVLLLLKARASGVPVPSANGQINPTYPHKVIGAYCNYLLKVLPTYWKEYA